MPNWCTGNLKISGSERDLRRFAEFARNGESLVLDTERFVPRPESEQALPGRDWYLKHWGTKWGICGPEVVSQDFAKGFIGYSFFTAWSPCKPVVLAMARRFSGLRFDYTYRERGAGYKGRLLCEAGNKVLMDRAWACVGYDWRSFPEP